MKEIQFTYKLKLILVLSIGVILGYIGYTRKISATIERVKRINELNESTQSDQALLNNQISALLLQKKEMEEAISFSQNSSFESYLINEITTYNAKINVTNVSDLYTVKDGNYAISSLYLTLQNDFKTILKLTDYIEKELSSVNIISIHYFSKKINYNSSKKNLYATIYLQNIKNS